MATVKNSTSASSCSASALNTTLRLQRSRATCNTAGTYLHTSVARASSAGFLSLPGLSSSAAASASCKVQSAATIHLRYRRTWRIISALKKLSTVSIALAKARRASIWLFSTTLAAVSGVSPAGSET